MLTLGLSKHSWTLTSAKMKFILSVQDLRTTSFTVHVYDCLLIQCTSHEPILSRRWSVGLNVFPSCVCVFHVTWDIHVVQASSHKHKHSNPYLLPTPPTTRPAPRYSWLEQSKRGTQVPLVITLHFVSMFTRFYFLFEFHERFLPTARTQIARS